MGLQRSWRAILTALFVVWLHALGSYSPADALTPSAVYTAPDGFQVVSYSEAWVDQAKLKSVYDELQKNRHGEEFKLLTKINIYPGAAVDNPSLTGRWNGSWKLENGKPVLLGDRQIDIFKGDQNTTLAAIARTLSHEYGHHFTYYYYFKKEQKEWDDWKTSSLADVRKLKSEPLVSSSAQDHKWMIQEIAAEDYVQLFGSPTSKTSWQFADIAQRLATPQQIRHLARICIILCLRKTWLCRWRLTFPG